MIETPTLMQQIEPQKYSLVNKGSTLIFTFGELTFDVSKINPHKDGSTTCVLTVTTNNPNYNHHLLFQNFNLAAMRTRTELKNTLKEKYKEKVDWDYILENLCIRTLKEISVGDPVLEIWGGLGEEIPQPGFSIEPIIYEKVPNMIFGDGGSCKSTLALTIVIVTTLPLIHNLFGWKVKQMHPLYLDWESDKSLIGRDFSRLCTGLDVSAVPLKYRKCKRPLAEDLDDLEKIIVNEGIDFLVIDSLGLAAATDRLKEERSAQDFFAALNYLNVTSLIVAHPPKQTDTQVEAKRSPYGSIFFTNYIRNQYEIRKNQEEGETNMDVAFFHRKCNLGGLQKPFAINLEFTDRAIYVKPKSIAEVGNLGLAVSLNTQIRNYMRDGAKTLDEVAEAVAKPKALVSVYLSNLAAKGLIVHVGNKWGLPSAFNNQSSLV